MDPNLFHLDWERLAEVIATIIVLAMIVERGLAVVFESKWWIQYEGLQPWRELVALAVSFGVCLYLHFDALSIIVLTDRTHWLGELITAMVISGGSKASLKLFHDLMNIKSTAYRQREQIWEERRAAQAAAANPPPANPPAPNVP